VKKNANFMRMLKLPLKLVGGLNLGGFGVDTVYGGSEHVGT